MLPQEVQNKNLTDINRNKEVYDNSCRFKKTSQDKRPVCTLKNMRYMKEMEDTNKWEDFSCS